MPDTFTKDSIYLAIALINFSKVNLVIEQSSSSNTCKRKSTRSLTSKRKHYSTRNLVVKKNLNHQIADTVRAS